MNLKNLAIIGVNKAAVSETFIRAHVEKLSGRNHYIFWGPGGYSTKEGILVSTSLFGRILRNIPGLRTKFDTEGRLEAYLKRNRIHCVLAEYGPTGVNVMPVCGRLNIPFVVHFHGYDASYKKVLDQYSNAYGIMFREAAGIVAVSRKMEQDLLRLGCPREKLVYNPYGPAPALFSNMPDTKEGYFLAVGRFVEKKAPHLLLLAFGNVVKEEPNARLVMVGDGPLLGACKWLAKSIGISDHVTFEGALPQEETQQRFGKAFCFVQHSVIATNGDSEGTPVALLEAGAAALPVIATRHAGIPDVVVEEQTGILVEEGDVEGMAAAMLRLYRDRSLCAQMGAAARRHIRENFSMEKHIGILNGLIEQAINDKR